MTPTTLLVLLPALAGTHTSLSKRAARVGGSALLREVDAARREEGESSRQARGLLDMFEALSDLRTDSTLIRGGNTTEYDQRGILDFVADVASSLLGGATDKNDAPVLIPIHCW